MNVRRPLLLAIASSMFLSTHVSAQLSEALHATDDHFDSQPWIDDFHQLLKEMESHYADLDWAVYDRHMNLPKLRQETDEKLRQSTDVQAAQRAIEQFLSSFGDGHLSVTWPGIIAERPASGPIQSLCSTLGYKDPAKRGIDFSLLPGFANVPGEGADVLYGGLLTLRHQTVGVIRIASFDEHGFPSECEAVIREIHLNDASVCDRNCARTVALQTANRLTALIASRAQQLRTLGASALVIDITRNDGGDDWNEAVARTLSRIPLTEERRGFIKHPMWTAKLERDLAQVESDIKKGREPRNVLEGAAGELRNDIALSRQTCDRSGVFETGNLPCSLVVKGDLFWSGILSYAKPNSFAELESKTTLFNPLQYKYVESANRLPLFIAVDGHSWSSAERFAALLQDNGAATVIGELTGGAGCGSVDGGIPTMLEHSHAQVNIPNCVGFRKDGSNANNGVTPDIFVPWEARDTPFTRADKLRAALDKSYSLR